jgi:hypothetical protein
VERGDRRLEDALDQLRHLRPDVAVEDADGATRHRLGRDRVVDGARLDAAEADRQARARVDHAGQRPGQVGDHPRDRVDEIGGQVGSGGVPTWSAQPDLHQVRGGGDRPDPHADLADVDLGVAVEREDGGDVLDLEGVDDVNGAAGDLLLGRLEDQPHAAAQPVAVLGQRQPGPEQDGGVQIVPAGVADPWHGRAVGNVLLVLEREGVDVGAQRDGRAVAVAHVADQPRAGGQQARAQADRFEAAGDQGGGLALSTAELRVLVQMAAQVCQLCAMCRQKVTQVESHGMPGFGGGIGRGKSACRCRTGSYRFPFAKSKRKLLLLTIPPLRVIL